MKNSTLFYLTILGLFIIWLNYMNFPNLLIAEGIIVLFFYLLISTYEYDFQIKDKDKIIPKKFNIFNIIDKLLNSLPQIIKNKDESNKS